jgi:hypothetical protein
MFGMGDDPLEKRVSDGRSTPLQEDEDIARLR